MSERYKGHGKREAPSSSGPAAWWRQYRDWVTGMSRRQRLRYRLLQTAVILSVIVIAVYLALSAWVKVPEVPVFDDTPGPGSSSSAPGISFEGAQVPDIVRSGRREGVYTFLVAGRDVSSGSTDTMLLVTYDTKAKTIHGLNLPRDTMVNVATTSKRLNAVYNYNRGKDAATQAEKGMTALKGQVAKLTGIMPDFYVLVEWEAIGELVDALGGVEFEVPFDMDYDDPYQDPPLHIHQKAGLRVLNGDDAMQVIRFRKSNDREIQLGDTGRVDIQQDFLKAVVKKCLQPATFLKIPNLVDIFVDNVKTDLTVGNLLAFAQLALGMDPETGVSFTTAPLGDSFHYHGAALVTLSQNKLLEILNSGMNPYLRDLAAGDLELVYRKSDGSMAVTNGTLADPAMAEVPVVEPESPQPGEEIPGEEDPGEEPPSEELPGEELPGEDPEQPDGPGPELPGVIDPGDIFPELEEPDEQGGSQDIAQDIPQDVSQDIPQLEGNDPVAVLPSRPEPVEAAA